MYVCCNSSMTGCMPLSSRRLIHEFAKLFGVRELKSPNAKHALRVAAALGAYKSGHARLPGRNAHVRTTTIEKNIIRLYRDWAFVVKATGCTVNRTQ